MSKQSFWSQKNLGRHSEVPAPWGHSQTKKIFLKMYRVTYRWKENLMLIIF